MPHIDFDTDLFACHDLPLAAYVEPEGYQRLAALSRVKIDQYAEMVPQTTRIAHALYDSLPQHERWGKQIIGFRGPQWVTETQWKPMTSQNDRPGQSLALRDVLRCLTRSQCYSLGRTDMHVEEREEDWHRPGHIRTTQVNCLCLDVDMDTAWANRNQDAIRHELMRERMIASALGLPFRAFRTGGRGHQVVMPLPAFIDRSAASWILGAYLTILMPYHTHEAETTAKSHQPSTKADVSNLDGLVRVAGGRHARTQRLGLWIDPTTARLFDLPIQIEMMENAYYAPPCESRTRETFVEAAEEISDLLERRQITERHHVMYDGHYGFTFWGAETHLPDNPLVCCFYQAHEALALEPFDRLSGERHLEPKRKHVEKEAGGGSSGMRSWARRVWAMPWEQGQFWGWLNGAGSNGIAAASVLFRDRTKGELYSRAKRESPSQSKAEERIEQIDFCLKTFDLNKYLLPTMPELITGELSPHAVLLLPDILEAVGKKKRIQERNRTDIERTAHILLLALQKSATGFINLSLDSIADSIEAKWPTPKGQKAVDRSTIYRHIKRLKDGEEICGFALVEEIPPNGSGQVMATRYRPGSDLLLAGFGECIAYEALAVVLPAATQSLPMRVRRAGGQIVIVDFSPKKRGRKLKAHQEIGR